MSGLQIATVAAVTPLTVRQRATGASVAAVVMDGSGYAPTVGDRVVGAMFLSNRFTIIGSLAAASGLPDGIAPSITAWPSADVTVTTGTLKTAALNSTSTVRGGMSLVSTKILVSESGLYLVNAQVTWTYVDIAHPALLTWTSGGTQFGSQPTGSGGQQARASRVNHYAAGASVALQTKQSTGATKKLRGGVALTFISLTWLGP